MKDKVLITTSTFGVADQAPIQKLEQAGFEVMLNPHKRKVTKDELKELLPGVKGLIAGLETLDRDIMEASELKVISRCGIGMSNVDVNAANDLGIKVCNTPDAPTVSVAELTVACMLALLRKISLMDRDLHNGNWNKQTGYQLSGKTVAIIGYGRIGRKVAELIAPFGVKVIAVDPFVKDTETVSMEEALPQADIVTLHSSGEECLIGAPEIQRMKKGAFLLNASRGALIDEDALVKALDEGHLAGVWMDTFETEPYTGRLTRYDQALLTPHVGSYSAEGRIQMETEAVDNLLNHYPAEVH